MRPNTSVYNDWGGFYYAQYVNNTFAATAVTMDNSDALILAGTAAIGPIQGMPETRISGVPALVDDSKSIRTIFVQVNGSNITQIQQQTSGGAWSEMAIPVG